MTGSRWARVAVVVVLGALAAAWWSSRPSSTVLNAGRDESAAPPQTPGGSRRVNAVADVTEGGLSIEDELEPLPLEEWVKHGRPASTGDVILIRTGISDGPVHVAVEALAGPPAALEPDGWEEVAEISINPMGRLRVSTFYGDDTVGNLPVLNPSGPGPHRLRVHASGRDGNYDLVDEEPRERYLLLVWPAPPAPNLVLKEAVRVNGSPSASSLAWIIPRTREPDGPPRSQAPAVPPPTVTAVGR